MISLCKVGRFGVVKSSTGIVPFNLERVLYNNLMYKKKGIEFMANPLWGIIRLYSLKKHSFPWGLLDRVLEVVKSFKKQIGEDYEIVINDTKLERKDIDLSILRYYQKDAIDKLYENNGGLISLPTGSGKTFVGVYFLKCLREEQNTMILVPTIDLKNQWIEDLEKFKVKARVETYQHYIRRLGELKEFDIIICDEVHHVSAKTFYKIVMNCHNAKIVGLSATCYRDDGEDMKIEASAGKVVYKVTIQELVEKGYLVNAKVNILGQKLEYFVPYNFDYRDVVTNYLVKNQSRNQIIVNKAIECCDKGVVLILIEMIEHGTLLSSMLDTTKIPYIFVNGSSKERKKIFNEVLNDKYKIVIATKIYGEGVNLPNLKYLILGGGGRSSVKVVQQSGRILRLFSGKSHATIYDFQDNVKYLKSHFNRRMKIYQELGFEVHE